MIRSEMMVVNLPVHIERKKSLKNMYIRIYPPDGRVTVSAPLSTSEDTIRQYILKKMPEINKTREKMLGQKRQSKREYVSGEAHYLWGKAYRLQVISDGMKRGIKRVGNKIILTVPEDSDESTKEKLMTEWYRAELKRSIPDVLERCQKRMNVNANEWRVKNMTTKWGTCNISKRRIWLNLQLVKKPPECLEYIIVHELVHLIEKNHTDKFQALMDKYYPTWREVKRTLNEAPLEHLEVNNFDC